MPGFKRLAGRSAARLAFLISKFRNKGRISPAYSRFDVAWRCISLILATQGMDMLGARIYRFETDFILANPGGVLTPDYLLFRAPGYIFWLGAQGALIGLALWRLLELYWFARDLGNKKNRPFYLKEYGVEE